MNFTYVNSNSDCPENTGLGFAECKEATGTVPSVARRRAFRRRRQLSLQLVDSVESGGYLQLRRSTSGCQLQTGIQFVLDGE